MKQVISLSGLRLPHTSGGMSMLIHDMQVFVFLVLSFVILLLFLRTKNKKNYRFGKILFVIIFLFILFLPLFQQRFTLFQFNPLVENRYRAPAPRLSIFPALFLRKNDYAKKFETYFNDAFGFRDILIKLKNQIDYTFFRYSSEILIGKDNWLFYKSVSEVAEVKLNKSDNKTFALTINHMLYVNSRLNQKGILFVVLPIPDKSTVYPENNTGTTIIAPSTSRFYTFMQMLKSHPEIKVVDALAILLSEKKNYTLFHKTDMHWNDVGASYVSQHIISQLAEYTKTPLNWFYPLSVHYYENFTGGQLSALALIFPTLESKLTTQGKKEFASESLPTPKRFDYHFVSSLGSSRSLLPKTVIIGNSFTENFMDTGLVDHFSELYVLRSCNAEHMRECIPEGTKIVIWQLIEESLADEIKVQL